MQVSFRTSSRASASCPHAGQSADAVIATMQKRIVPNVLLGNGLQRNPNGEIAIDVADDTLELTDDGLRSSMREKENTWTESNTFIKTIITPEVRIVSSEAYKRDIQPVDEESATRCIKDLNICSYTHAMTNARQIGVLAHEANAALSIFLTEDRPESVNYNNIAMVNTVVLQKVLRKIEALERRAEETDKNPQISSDIV